MILETIGVDDSGYLDLEDARLFILEELKNTEDCHLLVDAADFHEYFLKAGLSHDGKISKVKAAIFIKNHLNY